MAAGSPMSPPGVNCVRIGRPAFRATWSAQQGSQPSTVRLTYQTPLLLVDRARSNPVAVDRAGAFGRIAAPCRDRPHLTDAALILVAVVVRAHSPFDVAVDLPLIPTLPDQRSRATELPGPAHAVSTVTRMRMVLMSASNRSSDAAPPFCARLDCRNTAPSGATNFPVSGS